MMAWGFYMDGCYGLEDRRIGVDLPAFGMSAAVLGLAILGTVALTTLVLVITDRMAIRKQHLERWRRHVEAVLREELDAMHVSWSGAHDSWEQDL